MSQDVLKQIEEFKGRELVAAIWNEYQKKKTGTEVMLRAEFVNCK